MCCATIDLQECEQFAEGDEVAAVSAATDGGTVLGVDRYARVIQSLGDKDEERGPVVGEFSDL
jgi:hypothetical protein